MATKRKTRKRKAPETASHKRKRLLAIRKYKHIAVDPGPKDNPRKVKGRSTTLRNMASVTIQKLPNGVVKITGRKMAGKGHRNPRAPRNGYVVYPGSLGFMSLTAANKEAKKESLQDGQARVENVDTNKTVSRWKWG